MERQEKKPITVPQFGGWDHNAPGASNYSMVFTQARENRKLMKTDLTEVKRKSLGNELDLLNTNRNHGHLRHAQSLPHPHAHRHAHGHVHDHALDEPVVLVRPFS
ncbi:hypothetical protein RIF29_17794 [Crotalaria pallida]|uniref:RIN4 pathogenic type III effector avirulence factor Avr cleavage site domain-containing protein n=1 Tax=Crotalaria pallida TaxID=3830 RepID=A0AAN9FIR5_CROPI